MNTIRVFFLSIVVMSIIQNIWGSESEGKDLLRDALVYAGKDGALPSEDEALFLMGRRCQAGQEPFASMDYTERSSLMKRYYQEAAERCHGEALYELGQISLRENNAERAEKYFEQAVERGCWSGLKGLARIVLKAKTARWRKVAKNERVMQAAELLARGGIAGSGVCQRNYMLKKKGLNLN